MRRSQKSKRVTWASDDNLYQVRLFCPEESPALVGLGTQNHLQAKAFWPLLSRGTGLDDNLPPGFEGIEPAKLWRIKLSQIPLITWRCPPSFEVNSSWRVVAGEESIEMEAQKRREMTMLEAIYPRSSTIPPNPSVSAGADDSVINDQNTPLVPITPVEDEDIASDTTFGSIARNTDSADNKRVATGVEPDTVLAAQVALSLITSKSYQGNLIDRELLIKILSDPKMIEQLITNHAALSSTQNMSRSSHITNTLPSKVQTMPAIGVHTVSSTSMPNLRPLPKNLFNPVSIAVNRRGPELITPSMSTNNLPLYPPSRNLRPSVPDVTPVPSPEVPKGKDINYYKSLIQQHGEERREILPRYSHQTNEVQLGISREPSNIAKSRDSKQKMMKPCIFFNSSRGCRNGVNCAYLHGSSAQQKVIGIQEVQSAKRAKIHR
ncbi:zinc finger CCCH domain-containing protein 6-like isoform X1 [Primulina huaijiensis]|uniref:zinc finger CCCH domain-containing protein 6-like isoform X1 n=1 Tax=Primulina huaijiensis TaxID=1492673 RepID=UPI003CC75BCF